MAFKGSERISESVRVLNNRKPKWAKDITVERWGGQGWCVDYDNGSRRIGGRFKTARETVAFLDGMIEAFELDFQRKARA